MHTPTKLVRCCVPKWTILSPFVLCQRRTVLTAANVDKHFFHLILQSFFCVSEVKCNLDAIAADPSVETTEVSEFSVGETVTINCATGYNPPGGAANPEPALCELQPGGNSALFIFTACEGKCETYF